MPCRTVASQLVRHHHPRHILRALQQPLEEPPSAFGIRPALNEDVEHDAVLIHVTPEILLLPLEASAWQRLSRLTARRV
jgi:hypothetical protein